MTLAQAKKFVTELLLKRTCQSSSVVTTSGGVPLTFDGLMTVVRTMTGIAQAQRHAPETIIVSPEMAQRFAETPLNPNLYGTLTIHVNPYVPPGQAFKIHTPE